MAQPKNQEIINILYLSITAGAIAFAGVVAISALINNATQDEPLSPFVKSLISIPLSVAAPLTTIGVFKKLLNKREYYVKNSDDVEMTRRNVM